MKNINIENCKTFITSGLASAKNPAAFKRGAFSGLLFTCLIIAPICFIHGGAGYITVALLQIAFTLACGIIPCRMIKDGKAPIRSILIADLLSTVALIETLAMAAFIAYTDIIGWSLSLFLLIFIPPIVFPVVAGFCFSKKLHSEESLQVYKFPMGVFFGHIVAVTGFTMLLRPFLDKISQPMIAYVILIGVSIVNAFLSIGLVQIQRLAYLKKLENDGVIEKNATEL